MRGRPADLVADLAEPIPVAVIAELLGVPESDRHLLRPWSRAIVALFELEHGGGGRARGRLGEPRSSGRTCWTSPPPAGARPGTTC